MSHQGPNKTSAEKLAIQKYHRLQRARGVGEMMKHGAAIEAAEVLKRWHVMGMTYYQMADQIGLSEATLCNVVTLQRGKVKGEVVGICRKTYNAIMSIKWEEPIGFGARVPACGMRRRLQALQVAGFTLAFISEPMGRHSTQVSFMARNDAKYTYYSMHKAVVGVFDKLISVDPLDVGQTPRQVAVAKAAAKRNGYAPWTAWDDDTIDSPDAYPEWTGACGTQTGVNIHRKMGTSERLCRPCSDFRKQKRADYK